MALLIFLYRQDSDAGRHEDNNENEPTPTVEVEAEPTETPVFGVPEGQVDADKDKLYLKRLQTGHSSGVRSSMIMMSMRT